MTAREQAIYAMKRDSASARLHLWQCGRLIDSVPDDALVDLLVERGVLEPVTLPHGNHTISVYQRKDT